MTTQLLVAIMGVVTVVCIYFWVVRKKPGEADASAQ